jgi:EamA-like transporter family
MKVAEDLRFKTYLFIGLLVCFGPVGDALMSKGMRSIGTPSSLRLAALTHYAFLVFTSPLVWLGTLCMIGFFVSYVSVLSWADYSYVQPATALTYGIVALLGEYVLGERVGLLHWIGIGVVCAGVLVISYTAPSTVPPVPPPFGTGPVE